jgi:hypothetical protein
MNGKAGKATFKLLFLAKELSLWTKNLLNGKLFMALFTEKVKMKT